MGDVGELGMWGSGGCGGCGKNILSIFTHAECGLLAGKMPALQEVLGYFLNWKSLREI